MLIVTFGESTVINTGAYQWYKRFKKSREEINDSKRSGGHRISTTDDNIEQVKKMIMKIAESQMSLMIMVYHLTHAKKFF